MASTHWHYVEEGERRGPIDEPEFARLAAEGVIGPRTLVWHTGLDGWKSFCELFPAQAPGTPPPLSFLPSGAASCCSVCGAARPERDLLPLDYSRVCLRCKPDFNARLREGFSDTSGMPFGGFWRRFGALSLDYVIMGAFNGVLVLPIYFALDRASGTALTVALFLLTATMPYVSQAAYEIWMVGRWGATLGKMAFGLEVVTAEGRRLSYLHSTGRHFAKHISGILLGLGYLMAAFDAEKKTLHDLMCSTRVIRK